jgi:hypothetical protein
MQKYRFLPVFPLKKGCFQALFYTQNECFVDNLNKCLTVSV